LQVAIPPNSLNVLSGEHPVVLSGDTSRLIQTIVLITPRTQSFSGLVTREVDLCSLPSPIKVPRGVFGEDKFLRS